MAQEPSQLTDSEFVHVNIAAYLDETLDQASKDYPRDAPNWS